MKKFAFTLQETLIVIAILGIVAVLIMPSIINKQKETAKRTKIKKAMSVYENAIQNICVTNRIKSKTELISHIKESNCENVVQYFKVTQRQGCKFRTSDGILWDVEKIDRAMIAFKNDDLTAEKAKDFDNKNAFILVTSFDSQGIIRVDDLSYETENPVDYSDVYVAKLYDMFGNDSEISEFKKCKAKSSNICKIIIDGKTYTYTKVNIDGGTISEDNANFATGASNLCFYNSETNKQTCGQTSTSKSGEYYIMQYLPTESEAKSEENCARSKYSECSTKGDYYEAEKRKCEEQGARMANLAEVSSLASQGKLIWDTNVIEENTKPGSRSYAVYADGRVHINTKSVTGRRAVCIGVE